MNDDQFVAKERDRMAVIQEAVEAAMAVIGKFDEEDPDVRAYVTYKAGAQILLSGVQLGIDRRVMLSDIGLTQLIKLETEAKLPEEWARCGCGRSCVVSGSDGNHLVCSGCLGMPKFCSCTTLSPQSPLRVKPV